MGEVEFFLISIDEIKSKNTEESASPDRTVETPTPARTSEAKLVRSSEFDMEKEKSYSATYFGSDFNYATQPEFRKKFKQYTMFPNVLEIGLIADEVNNNNDNRNNEDGNLIDPADESAYRDFMLNL